MSLAQVAQFAGVTRGFLSQLELGVSSASIGTLYKVCGALGIEFTGLFAQPNASLLRREDRVPAHFGGDGITDYVLTPRQERRAQVIETHLEPGGSADSELWTTHGDLVVVTVIKGALEVRLGEERTKLSVGDAMTFDPRVPHTWLNPSSRYGAIVLFFDIPATL